jgi:hypothetical protein
MEVVVPCPRCRAVSDAMLRWKYSFSNSLRIELGTFGEYETALNCKTCQAVVEYFRNHQDFDDLDLPASSYHIWFGRMPHKQRFIISSVGR